MGGAEYGSMRGNVELIWIPISVAAALMQAVRTAAQKELNRSLSTLVTTYVRSLFGLPFLFVYLIVVMTVTGSEQPQLHGTFLMHSLAAAISQMAATAFLIHLFSLHNFAVGTMLTKTDVMMTAVFGTVLFSETITATGWLAIFVTLFGVGLMSSARLAGPGGRDSSVKWLSMVFARPIQIGLLAGLAFCLSYLFLREASLSLQGGFLERAAWTVVTVTVLQVVLLGCWLAWREPGALGQMWPHWRPCLFIGLTSALGSIGWFTAMTLINASYVKAVGQIEIVFTLGISWWYFRERITARELAGIAVIVIGILLFLA